MSLAALSLTALPAAAELAKSAAQGGARLSGQFLEMLTGSSMAEPSEADVASAETPAATGSSASLGRSGKANEVQGATKSWCERFMQWLSQQRSSGANGELEVNLSLDELDQPQIEISGEGAAELEAAVAGNSTWLQEFRDLAFDHAQSVGKSTPMSLKVSLQSGSIDADSESAPEQLQAQWMNP